MTDTLTRRAEGCSSRGLKIVLSFIFIIIFIFIAIAVIFNLEKTVLASSAHYPVKLLQSGLDNEGDNNQYILRFSQFSN